jgi:hypothetical protein
MYAIVYADEGASFIGEISETLYAARPMVKIECPATSMQLGRTLLLAVGSVRLIRMLPSAALMQAFAEFHADTHCGGDEADLYQIVNGYYPWEAIRATDGDDDDEDVAA